MARRSKYRPRKNNVYQDSPLLDLPGETRMLIYEAALVRADPIDLFPRKYIEKPEDNPGLAKRKAKAVDEAPPLSTYNRDNHEPKFRDQKDLQYVRKEMATGLMATCKQIQWEAGHLFWTQNTFRFSSDMEWNGCRRFFTAIGPRALSLIRKLEVFLPLEGSRGLQATEEFEFEDIERAKNHPKMHMGKAPKDNRSWYVDMTTTNVEHVCQLLDEWKMSLELRLILPSGFRLLLEDDEDFLYIPKSLKIGPRFSGMTLVVEAGAFLDGEKLPKRLAEEYEMNIVCLPGSSWKYSTNATDAESIVLETKRWTNPRPDLDYLSGIELLLKEEEDVSVAGLGGRATKTPGKLNTSRVLKQFGGCRFVRRTGLDCHNCGATLVVTGKSGPASRGVCNRCGLNTYFEERDVIEVKKVARAHQQGFTSDNALYSHWRAS
ncbi:uncharacterized protein BDZ99DRAFT_467306 [Mytilinidion resinicola]|uniref:GATA-type domain-containing protein n=1 Tax=Mytilinidion resinicola TaxID=574789 RepID=A0A6A6Y7U3_9PEZI|nr:uncharacterized protein BDZ99DRAFT_467306 [Mytilinidion resinicola]KAF2804618.1 hypothetical protein BDZ99DRAFT_467306 [Mytilinidion resinicola]